MTDVPPGNGRPGDDPEASVDPGVRRSSFTSPADDPEPQAFDDDALADALAAQVSSYTSPIPTIPPAAAVVADVPVEPDHAGPEAEVREGEVAEAPVLAPAPVEAPAFAAPEPVSETLPEPSPEPATSSSSTLQAIERLEDELRRRAEESRSTPIPVEAPPPEATPVSPASALAEPVAADPVTPDPVTPDPAAPDLAAPEPLAPAPSGAAPTPPAIFPAPDAPRFPSPPTFLRPAESAPEQEPASDPTPPVAEPAPTPEPEPVAPSAWGGPVPAPPSPVPVAPPTLVEPPVLVEPRTTGSIPVSALAPPEPVAPPFGVPPATPPIDLPPPGGSRDFAHLPPPIGIAPAQLPPYEPAAQSIVPTPPDGMPFDPPVTTHPGTAAPVTELTEDDDAVDEVDRAYGRGAIAVDSTGAVTLVHPPSEPISTTRLTDDEAGLVDAEPESHPPLTVESAGPEPTALDLRAGRAARLFWLWFAANSSVVTLSLGAILFGLGMSLRQVLIAIVLGIALSFVPLGLGTLAGKWSGQPTMIVSRATFGLVGNALPAALALVSRLFWGGALLWVLAAGVARVLVDAGLDAGLGELVWTFVGLGVGFALAFVVAIFGYGLIARVQLVLSILTGVLVVGVIVLTWPRLDLTAFPSIDDGSWTLLITGVVLVFSFVGLAWVHSSGDLARYQRSESDGGSTMLWATFGATLPALALLIWGALLAASDPLIADGLATNPLYTIAAILPLWYPAPLIAALSLGLLSGAVLTIYSGGFALQSLGVNLRRSGTTVIAGLLILIAAAAIVLLAGDARTLVREVATTIAVPVAAWAGIFGAEIMIRRNGFASDDLLRRGGIYPAVRWVNLIGLIVIAGIGFGLTSAARPGLDWQGYLLPFLSLPTGDPLLTSDAGVLVALVLGILLPLITAIPTIRRQERALID